MAYAPQPELAHQLALALEPDRPLATVTAIRPVSGNATPAFLERLEEEIPAKWLREVARVYAENEACRQRKVSLASPHTYWADRHACSGRASGCGRGAGGD